MAWTSSALRKWLARQLTQDVPLSTIPADAADALASLQLCGKVVVWMAQGVMVATSTVTPRQQYRSSSGLKFNSELEPGQQIEDMEDTGAGYPPDIVEATEELERTTTPQEPRRKPRGDYAVIRERSNLPRPTVLLTGSRAWDGITRRGAFCPACWGRKLRPSVYCLRCDRWGLDHLVPKVKPTEVKVVKVQSMASRMKHKRSKTG